MDVIVYPSAMDRMKNRGFAFVEYESHKAAAMARRKLIPGGGNIQKDLFVVLDMASIIISFAHTFLLGQPCLFPSSHLGTCWYSML